MISVKIVTLYPAMTLHYYLFDMQASSMGLKSVIFGRYLVTIGSHQVEISTFDPIMYTFSGRS